VSGAIRVRGRFAPSPTGRLHFGSLVAALGSWLCARSQGGRWVIRMEDIDSAREIPGAGADIIDTLAAFGLHSDEPVVLQSQRVDRYEAAFRTLSDLGVVYACRCSRNDLAAFDGIHPEHCVADHAGDRADPAWRLRVGKARVAFVDRGHGPMVQQLDRDVGDFVVRRADGGYTYQLAVVVDDAAQGISEVVRGADLLDSTPRQIFLQQQLGLSTPGYRHLPLVVDEHGRKLSKHDNARPVDQQDPLPALRSALAFLGQRVPSSPRIEGFLRDAVTMFEPGRIPRSAHTHVAMRKD
jgi:glutamyl-Q tRNA(Asp) synthetase